MALHTVLGAGGAIANGLVPILLERGHAVRLVSRSARECPGTEAVRADISAAADTLEAVRGSSVVYLLVGLPYDTRVWAEQWPKIMTNVITACRECSAKLVFFDNVYAYGKVEGPMTEATPVNPCSRKGEIRAKIAIQLLNVMKAGDVNALVARSADFYGPGGERTSVPDMLVFANLKKGKKAQWLANATVPHSFTFIPDAARALCQLAEAETAFGQTWHLPTAPNPLTGTEFVELAAQAMNRSPGITVMQPWMLRLAGLFNVTIRESVEMLYQSQYPYIFDSTKFEQAFNVAPTSYEEGIRASAGCYR